MSDYYLEVDFYQIKKSGQIACGDSFVSKKSVDKTVSIMADGLGSGIKACVLSTLTTTMAAAFVNSKMDVRKTAEVILETLPICSKRKIGYSTFTIIDACTDGTTRIIEYDNPPYILFRNGQVIKTDKQLVELEAERKSRIYYSEFKLLPEDKIVFYTDGVSQSGMGQTAYPLGWLDSGVESCLTEMLGANPNLSAGEISKKIALKARDFDRGKPADDITCAAIYFRNPRRTLLITGPPYKADDDSVMVRMISEFKGKKVICGGTTAMIVSRELGLQLNVNLSEINHLSEIPPTASMEGFDLVAEGTITLSRALRLLEEDGSLDATPNNAVRKLVLLLINSDIIECLVGTKINAAHQDPALPKDLELRRTLIKQLCKTLEDKYYKQTSIRYV